MSSNNHTRRTAALPSRVVEILQIFGRRAMIVGRGLLAKAFETHYSHREDILVFASGVSNSREYRIEEFERERRLLGDCLANNPARLIYFGSCAVGNPLEVRTPYLTHKAAMEHMALSSGRGLVLRLPQVVGPSSNPNTLINFLCRHLSTGQHFTVWAKAERNLIDIDDIVPIARVLIEEQWGRHDVVSIAAQKSVLVLEIVHAFEQALGVKGHYSIEEEKGVAFPIDTSIVEPLGGALGIDLGSNYLERIAAKYADKFTSRSSCD